MLGLASSEGLGTAFQPKPEQNNSLYIRKLNRPEFTKFPYQPDHRHGYEALRVEGAWLQKPYRCGYFKS